MKTVQELLQETLKIVADHDKLLLEASKVHEKHEFAINLLIEHTSLAAKLSEHQAAQISFLKEELAKFSTRIPCEDRRCQDRIQ
jgi:tRNA isopentenyl-2-thiomethyl-A-37 hydroxylase MiaE